MYRRALWEILRDLFQNCWFWSFHWIVSNKFWMFPELTSSGFSVNPQHHFLPHSYLFSFITDTTFSLSSSSWGHLHSDTAHQSHYITERLPGLISRLFARCAHPSHSLVWLINGIIIQSYITIHTSGKTIWKSSAWILSVRFSSHVVVIIRSISCIWTVALRLQTFAGSLSSS